MGQGGIYRQSIPLRRVPRTSGGTRLTHQNTAHVAQAVLRPDRLFVKPRIRVGGRGMGVIAALFAMKIALAVTAGAHTFQAGGVPDPSLGRKLFMLAQASMSVPSTEKWSVDSRVLTCRNARSPARTSSAKARIARKG